MHEVCEGPDAPVLAELPIAKVKVRFKLPGHGVDHGMEVFPKSRFFGSGLFCVVIVLFLQGVVVNEEIERRLYLLFSAVSGRAIAVSASIHGVFTIDGYARLRSIQINDDTEARLVNETPHFNKAFQSADGNFEAVPADGPPGGKIVVPDLAEK